MRRGLTRDRMVSGRAIGGWPGVAIVVLLGSLIGFALPAAAGDSELAGRWVPYPTLADDGGEAFTSDVAIGSHGSGIVDLRHPEGTIGSNKIPSRAPDPSGSAADAVAAVTFVDTTAPSVTITHTSLPSSFNPFIRFPVASWTITLSGTASDDVEVDRVELSAEWMDDPTPSADNGVNWVTATGTTSWEGTVTIFEGGNHIRVRAIDTSGNVAAEAGKFIDIHGPPLLGFLILGLIGGAGATVIAIFLLKRRREA